MLSCLRVGLFVVVSIVSLHTGYAQSLSPVRWSYVINTSSTRDLIVELSANLSSGWHLYSQHIGEGGPIATRIYFDHGDEYMLVGDTQEEGSATEFYDEVYEMSITWYAEAVKFKQRIRLNESVNTIKGRIEYMTCNGQMCYPKVESFDITIKPIADSK